MDAPVTPPMTAAPPTTTASELPPAPPLTTAPMKAVKSHAAAKIPAAAKTPVTAKAPVKPTAIKAHVRVSNLDEIYGRLVAGVKTFFAEQNFKRGVLGLSGGVDSALTLKIAVDALGAENVTALIMPELGLTKDENVDHAKMLCEFLGVAYFNQPINQFVVDFKNLPWGPSTLASMNTKARTRTVLLYHYANSERALVLGTSNKSELLLGYGTKYGDLAADLEVIADLYKTEVIKLADHIGLPLEIVNKVPSAELAADQSDEAELGGSYAELDKVLAKLELGPEACIAHGLPGALVQSVFRRVAENKHKTQLPFVIKAK